MRFFWQKQKVEQRDATPQYINPNSLNNAINVFGTNNRNNPTNISTVFRCIDLISDSCASLPIEVTKSGKPVKNNISLLFDNHFTLIKNMIKQMILFGNGYAYIERAVDGKPVNLKFLENCDVTIQYNKMTGNLYYLSPVVSNKKILPKDMLHFIKWTKDGVNGISLLSYAKNAIALANSSDGAAQDYFGNGMQPTSILQALNHTTYDERKDARDAFLNNIKANSIAVLPAEFKYEAVQANATDSQLLETRQYNTIDICRFFGISPILLGDLSHGGVNSIEETQVQFLVQTLSPYIIMIEEELNRKLATGGTTKISLDENYILRSNKQSQVSYYTGLLNAGVLSINEVREELGYEKVEGLDEHLIAFTDISQNKINSNGKEEENNNGNTDTKATKDIQSEEA